MKNRERKGKIDTGKIRGKRKNLKTKGKIDKEKMGGKVAE